MALKVRNTPLIELSNCLAIANCQSVGIKYKYKHYQKCFLDNVMGESHESFEILGNTSKREREREISVFFDCLQSILKLKLKLVLSLCMPPFYIKDIGYLLIMQRSFLHIAMSMNLSVL